LPPGRRRPVPDQEQRDRAIVERARNVLIDAGAGTGKTTILIDRLIEMVAPTGHEPAIPMDRLAAITFTRKAAGELRLRIRERLLEELAIAGQPPDREAHLRDALAALDTAWVGTIHSFADRLLRLRPVEAGLSPSYEIAEEDEALVRETFEVLLHGAQNDTLAAELAGTPAGERAREATTALLFALGVGLPSESRDLGWNTLHGLDALVAGFIRERDIPPPDAEPAPFDATSFQAAAEEFIERARAVRGPSSGSAWLGRMAALLGHLRTEREPLLILRRLRPLLQSAPGHQARKGHTFGGEEAAWALWQAFIKSGKPRPTPLRDELRTPLDRWMATRLVRLFPVVFAIYEKVKARRQALDQVDLLVKLRDLLARDRAVRGEFQGMFDHILVDEFQDTDPLQAEIVLFLCEREPVAGRWQDVVLRDGALTLVGDPKQSIYRFRRADIAMYETVRSLVASRALEVTLSANFRSTPALIDWLNDRFNRIFGLSPDGRPFDPLEGRVFQQPLAPAREGDARPSVHVLPFDFGDALKHTVDEYRTLEGQALARYLRWLVTASAITIVDSLDGQPRRIRYSDIAVLAVSTWRLPLLFPSLDREGVPYASRGGTLFLSDPLHRRFLLGLRAVADRDDGVADAALLRPPFFALDPLDLLQEQAARRSGVEPDGEGPRRAREARTLVRELRQQRLNRAPGATARDLLERTAFARTVAVGPNGAQRLTRLRELCLVLEQAAAADGLDFDGATAGLRTWVTDPIQLDPPHPVGTDALQVLTVHQAKGLEFPVVVLWDSKGQWDTRLDTAAWRMERDGRGWTMNLAWLSWEEPEGLDLRETEKRYLDAERRRVIYVATTRARDLLVIPRAGQVAPGKLVCGDLLHEAPPRLMHEPEPFRPGAEPRWAREAGREPASEPVGADQLEQYVQSRWFPAIADAARPRFRPAAVSGEAHAVRPVAAEEPVTSPVPQKPREGRFGSLFGDTVHRAIGLVLSDSRLPVEEAVRQAAAKAGLAEHLDDAVTDVSRALDSLRAEGLLGPLGSALQVEYPVAGPWSGGRLLSGYVDLLGTKDDRLILLDFKTDRPPSGPVEQTYPQYVAQVRTYGQLLADAGLAEASQIRCGLLFTGDGEIRWT
jgi:ATP-dependent helicase/nuclease subunit A